MKRRNFVIGLGATTLAGSTLLASGGFSRASTQRRVKVEIVGDEDAYLRLVYGDHELDVCSEIQTIELVELTNQLKHDITIDDVRVHSDHDGIIIHDVSYAPNVAVGESTVISLSVECNVTGAESATISFDIDGIGGDGAVWIQDRDIEIICICPIEMEETAWAYGGDKTSGVAEDPEDNAVRLIEGITTNRWGWYFTHDLSETERTAVMYAAAGNNNLDNGYPVGTVHSEHDGSTLTVTVEADSTLSASVESVTFEEVKLYIDESLDELVADNGAPGLFPYKQENGELIEFTFDLADNEWDETSVLVMAVHADTVFTVFDQ